MLLKPEDYYTQRNNTIRPNEACMPTTRVMFYIANNIPYKNTSKKYQDDDFFMDLLNTKEAKNFCYKKYPWAYNKLNPKKSYPPNEVHGMYGSWLDEKVTGERRSNFREDLSYLDYIELIESGQAIMTSGTFGSILGHAILFIGHDKKKKCFYIADPYGNYHTKYKDVKGYGIEMPYEDFNKIIKPLDTFQKWGHVLINPPVKKIKEPKFNILNPKHWGGRITK